MSVKLMAAAWELAIPATEKMVLLCLCDHANGEGVCWPGAEGIGRRCSLTERTVRKAIGWLDEHGWIAIEKCAGKVSTYRIDPGRKFTPEGNSPRKEIPEPRKEIPDTPEGNSDEPSITVIEPSLEGDLARASDAKPFPRPAWADRQHWSDFLKNRKRKRLPNTLSAYRKFLSDIYRLADDEWPPGRLLENAAAEGWGGIYEPKERANGRANDNRGSGRPGVDRRSNLQRAIDEGLANLGC